MVLIIAVAVYLASLVVHDWVPMFRLNDLERQAAHGIRPRVLAFLGNTIPVVVLLVIAILFPMGRLPLWASIYAGLYIVVFLVLVWLSWYQPYLFGTTPERERAAAHEYGRTVQVLPVRGTRVRPNLTHVILHLLFLIVAVLLVLRMFG